MAARITKRQKHNITRIQEDIGIKKPVKKWSFKKGDLVIIHGKSKAKGSVGIIMSIRSDGLCHVRTGTGMKYEKIVKIELIQKYNKK
tara:strand:- start:677 stop:937 length:261 start_codon:yes stop_codon:yes gene_type:complete